MTNYKYQRYLLTALDHFYQVIDRNALNHILISKICLLIFFVQHFSFLAESFLNSSDAKADYFILLLKIFYYSNFTNILLHLGSNALILAFHIIFLGLNLICMIWILKRAFFKKIKKIDQIIGSLFLIYNWCVWIPIISFHLHVLDIQNNSKDSNSILFACFIISILEIPITMGLSFFLNYFNRQFIFFDSNMLSPKYNSINLCVWLIRSLQPFLIIIFNGNISIFLCTNGIFFLLTLSHSLKNPFVSKKDLNAFDLSSKISFLILLLLMILIYFKLFSEPDFMFIYSLLVILAIKLGLKKNDSTFLDYLLDSDLNDRPVEICEILAKIHFSIEKNDEYRIFFQNYFHKHYKSCTKSECQLERLNLTSYFIIDYQNQTKSLLKLISTHIKDQFKRRKKLGNENFEYLVVKWATCIMQLEISPLKSFYELISNETDQNSKSFYYKAIIYFLKKKLIRQITFFLSEEKYKTVTNKNYSEYFDSMKLKLEMQKELVQLINAKINFFRRIDFKTSGTNFEQISQNMLKLAPNISAYKSKLFNLSKNNHLVLKIVYLKFSSIFYCVVLNTFNFAIDFERQYDELRKNSKLDLNDMLSNEMNFFDEKLVFCEASFSNSSGALIQSSLNEKFRSCFGYHHDMDGLKFINDLMPDFMKESHCFFLQDYINLDKEKFSERKKRIFSFGITKQEFIFPLRVSFSFNFNFYDDFVMHGAIKSLEEEDFLCFLCKTNGKILNLSKGMLKVFQKDLNNIEPSYLSLLNIFVFIPSLKEILINPSNIYIHYSYSREFIMPSNLKSLIKGSAIDNEKEIDERLFVFDNKNSLIKYDILFELNYYIHKFGSINEQTLEYISVEIKKISSQNEEKDLLNQRKMNFLTLEKNEFQDDHEIKSIEINFLDLELKGHSKLNKLIDKQGNEKIDFLLAFLEENRNNKIINNNIKNIKRF